MPAISKALRSTITPDGAILLDVERGQMFSLNVVGSKILELLGNGLDEAQIVAEVSAAYRTPVDQVGADVREFLELLTRHHLIDEKVERPQG